MLDVEWEKMPEKVRAKYIEILRSIPLGRRFEITAELCDAMRDAMAAGIRAMNPGISDEEVRKEVIKRTLPPDIVKKVYGW
jgi:methionine aminopeptidase